MNTKCNTSLIMNMKHNKIHIFLLIISLMFSTVLLSHAKAIELVELNNEQMEEASDTLKSDVKRIYELWEREPVTNLDIASEPTHNGRRFIYFPYDEGWEHWSYPIGNGYMGANVFGRTDVERIQLTEKTLFNTGLYGLGGLTSFAEIDIHFNHVNVEEYIRSLNLNEAIAHVSYLSGGVSHTREMFVSYPDQVMVINLKTEKPGELSFKLAPRIPYMKSLREEDKKTGTVIAKGNTIILSGALPKEGNNFEAQFKVLNNGGTLVAEGGSIRVEGANSVSIIVAAGTNYEFNSEVFLNSNRIKLDPSKFPHKRLSKIMADAVAKGPEKLKERHLADYKELFDGVDINLNSTVSKLPTHELLKGYQGDAKDTYLEELMFQYGRYLLIASSREKTLPSGLQGTWSQYEVTPWTGGYWHNINVQMNYWGAFSANLAETFEAYINYFKAYYPKAQECAAGFLEKHHPDRVSSEPGENGWAIGTGATPYKINMPGGHSGPGTGGFTTKMLMDYYEYTLDKEYLEDVAYPALLGMSRLFSKTLVEQGDYLLVSPSASPENPISKEQLKGQPGHLAEDGRHYVTKGCTFDQGFVWENHTDVLKLAKILGKNEPFLETIRAELPKLDPILIGDSGQIKEWREETIYSSIGQKNHRHISHLCPLYPGTLINSSTPEWKDAAIKTLNFRGDITTGWAMAHRINCWARLADGDRAHKIYQNFIEEKTVPNLWTLHPPFQIDGNFGVMAGVSEMLLQSHEGMISVLPALPKAWHTGSFDGLVARGNFVISAEWKEMNITELSVISRSGGTCRLNIRELNNANIMDANGKRVSSSISEDGVLTFETLPGQTIQIVSQPVLDNEGYGIQKSLSDEKPNVVFILADDLGIAGLHSYGTEYLETPNLDRLSTEGMRFDNGYSSHPTCQPSRIAILSGQYAPRTGGYRVMEHHQGKEHFIKYNVPKLTGLSLEKTTFAEHFKANGYTTAMYGKWHAGNYRADLHPRYHGFDEAHVCRGHYDDSRSDPPLKLPEGMDSNEYFTYEAIKFMKGAVKKEEPFFLYMPYYLIHAPFEAPPELISHFQNKLDGMEFKDHKKGRMPIVAAMTKHLDNCVGKLLSALKEMGIEENTIVIFTSDNGAYTPDLTGGFRGQKGDVYDGGLRVPYFFKWPGKIEAGSHSDEQITHIDLYPTFSDLAGLNRPEDYILDGESLAGLLTGKTKTLPERDIVCYYPKYGQLQENLQPPKWKFPWRNVIFSNNWKLREVVEYETYELYNLKEDPKEENDLSESSPEKRMELIKKLRLWEKKVGAPKLTLNPDYVLD
ncbi:MAG: sulfatase-like hydrolase/transferase [Melioribacteraceae bacterium]|nr:sulfatase-like hydrolase/transferase [Melioribacteraceae bacterium]